MALGGWLGDFLFDLSDAYTWSIAAVIVTTCIGIPLTLALPRHRRPTAIGSKAELKPAPIAEGQLGPTYTFIDIGRASRVTEKLH